MRFTIESERDSKRQELTAYEMRLARRVDGIDKQSIVFFSAPLGLRRTAFLAHMFADGRAARQWLYLPSTKRPASSPGARAATASWDPISATTTSI